MYEYYFILDFKAHFRVEKETFELLVQTLGPSLIVRNNGPNMPSAK